MSGGDTAWVLTSTALVLFMTIPGLALFYGGLVRTKNVLSVLMQCFAITCVVSLLWLICGYSMSFGDGNGFIGGLGKAMFAGVAEGTMKGSIPESAFALFQMTFAIITPALVVGGFAERMRFGACLLFAALWFLAVYAPVCHWVWGGGWLGELGVKDFAGGIVVHITAGAGALTAALVLGARRGFPHQVSPPHNMTLTVAGAGMLWVGWFGFNGGSALAANGDAAMAMLVTHISASAGAFVWMVAEWFRYGKPSALGAVTGMVAGLGTITPASGFVGPAGALDHRPVGRSVVFRRNELSEAHDAYRRFARRVSGARCRRLVGDAAHGRVRKQRARRVQRPGRHSDRPSVGCSGDRRIQRVDLHGRRHVRNPEDRRRVHGASGQCRRRDRRARPRSAQRAGLRPLTA